jgi:predicted pyridoxine 5'-phosphate oxidase superfamily flavin-nucleotide-binding protein
MTRLYGDQHRKLQDAHGTRDLADRIEDIASSTEFDEGAIGFIQSTEMFFLSSIDHQGRPTTSYKGGDAGFVKVLDSNTLIFPSYDGNGMYLSLGNITENPQVGLLFISFEAPHRLRVQGTATISTDPALMQHYKEAECVVTVKLSEYWQNCPRYIPKYEKVRDSRYVPREQCETPLAGWKQLDLMQDVINEADQKKAAEVGIIPIEAWIEKIQSGDNEA